MWGLPRSSSAAGLGELFDTLLVFENYPVDRAALAAERDGLRLGQVEGHDATHYPLTLMVQPGETAAAAARLPARPVRSGERRGAGRAADPAAGGGGRSADAAALPILGGRARHHPRAWSDTAHPRAVSNAHARGAACEPPATLPALFAAQAARTPDAIAVVFEDRTLTYAALDAHANRLAHHLRGLGVGPETVVGLCVERSPEMVVGLLGILKAGGAYLPLDPDYPRERLAFMLADAGARGAGDAAGAARAAAGSGRGRSHTSCGSTPTGRDRAAARNRARRSPRPAPPRLRDLHLGLDRHAKGRGR